MSPFHVIRGVLTLIIAPIVTFFVSALTLMDARWGRKSKVKVQAFPRFWGWAICRLAGVKVKIEGIHNLDAQQTYIFAGNHCSQFDIFSFQGYFPHDFRWIAKKELFRIPLLGQAMHHAGAIFIDRSHGRQALKSLDDAAKQIAAGDSVLIFPEGTRSPDGFLQEFKTGAILLAIKAGVPIIPIGFNGSYEVLPKKQILPRSGKITIRIGPAIPTDHYKSSDKQVLAHDLHAAVEKLLDDRYVPH